MPGQHATLGPSSSARWLACPASVRLAGDVPEREAGLPAREGTVAHEAAEIVASHLLGLITGEECQDRLAAWREECEESDDPLDPDEMIDYAHEYAERLQVIAGDHEDPEIYLEVRVDPDVPGCWGTADAIILSRTRLDVADYKYGQGVKVQAFENPQAMLYGLGALEELDLLGDVEEIHLHILQPRIGQEGSWLTYTLTPEELREWREKVARPAAELALSPGAPFGPSEVACRWCPASGMCRAQLEQVIAPDFRGDLLEPEEISEALDRLPEIKAWIKTLEERALEHAWNRGETVPGYKVVRTVGRRSIPDPEAADRLLGTYGLDLGEYGKISILPLGTLEKRRVDPDDPKSPTLLAVLTEAGLVVKGEGRVTLAPVTDRRAEVTREGQAAEDFSTELE